VGGNRVTDPGPQGDTQIDITVSRVTDFAALDAKWRDLETRSDPSFFQSWTWMGCLVEERFPDPVLVEAREAGRTVALALFNRARGVLYLGQSGNPRHDCIYVEFNGVLAESGREARLTAACLGAARVGLSRWPRLWRRRLVLGGVDEVTVASAAETGRVRRDRSLPSPIVDIAARKSCFLDNRSANTRHQLRRSNRHYMATNPVAISRAETVEQAWAFLAELQTLHQASWVARGHDGAFAQPFFGRFHRALIERGMARGEIDLLRIATGDPVIGLL